MKFRLGTNTVTGEDMVEIWRDGAFIAGIYSHEEGVRIVSKHLDGVEHEVASPPAVTVKFSN